MTTMTATEARKQLYSLLDDVTESHEPIQIAGADIKPVPYLHMPREAMAIDLFGLTAVNGVAARTLTLISPARVVQRME